MYSHNGCHCKSDRKLGEGVTCSKGLKLHGCPFMGATGCPIFFWVCVGVWETYLDRRTGSTPTVGSSRMRRSGFWSSAAPRDTLRFWPPLKTQKRKCQNEGTKYRVTDEFSPTFIIVWGCLISVYIWVGWERSRGQPARQTCLTTRSKTTTPEQQMMEACNLFMTDFPLFHSYDYCYKGYKILDKLAEWAHFLLEIQQRVRQSRDRL